MILIVIEIHFYNTIVFLFLLIFMILLLIIKHYKEQYNFRGIPTVF